MAMFPVVMYKSHDDHYTVEMTEEQYHRMVGQGGNIYRYEDVLEIHYEFGYMKRNRVTGEILKAVYFCQ